MAERERERRADEAQAHREARNDAAYDLIAQWSMAVLGLGQLVLTGFGLWFIKGTLDATREAVADTGEATKAMQEANAIARAIGTAQTRPYLIIKRSEITVVLGKSGFANVFVEVPMKNYGMTPAVSPNVSMNCVLWAPSGHGRSLIWQKPLARTADKDLTIAPGEEYAGIWAAFVIDATKEKDALPYQEFIKSGFEMIFNKEIYPISFSCDALFTYVDIEGQIQTTEYYRFDASVTEIGVPAKCSVLKLSYDPQGARDVYGV